MVASHQEQDTTNPYRMRAPCPQCLCGYGRLETRNGQDCVFCEACGQFCYNAPKVETGKAIRNVTSIHAVLSARQRARILLRAGKLCELCGSALSTGGQVDHILPVKIGLENGLTEVELNSDYNLMALCDACNLGKGTLVPSPQVYTRILRWWCKNEHA